MTSPQELTNVSAGELLEELNSFTASTVVRTLRFAADAVGNHVIVDCENEGQTKAAETVLQQVAEQLRGIANEVEANPK